MQNKHWEKHKLRKNIRSINVLLFTPLSVIVYNPLLHQINIAVKNRIKVIKLHQGKELHNLKLKQETTSYVDEHKHSYINTPYIISHLTFCHCSFIWSWSSYPNKIKRCCYWGRICTVLPRLVEKLNTYTGQWVSIVKKQTKMYLWCTS